ncbi:MAG: hypothetical protein HYT81_04590 [Gemmatimonadetes bacterium]|nr:hypothetical protein [Gemmatimonadota bacterium]
MRKPKLQIVVLFQNLGERQPYFANSPAPPLPGLLLAGLTPDLVEVEVRTRAGSRSGFGGGARR